MLLRGTYRLTLVDEGTSAARVRALAAETPFSTIVKSRLGHSLGGDWSSPNSTIQRFWNDIYRPRNALLHGGREPEWHVVLEAFATYDELVAFLSSRVTASWKSYPRTLAAWQDRWAGGEGQVPSGAGATVAALQAREPPYWLALD